MQELLEQIKKDLDLKYYKFFTDEMLFKSEYINTYQLKELIDLTKELDQKDIFYLVCSDYTIKIEENEKD